jgi:hypothetical protein
MINLPPVGSAVAYGSSSTSRTAPANTNFDLTVRARPIRHCGLRRDAVDHPTALNPVFRAEVGATAMKPLGSTQLRPRPELDLGTIRGSTTVAS